MTKMIIIMFDCRWSLGVVCHSVPHMYCANHWETWIQASASVAGLSSAWSSSGYTNMRVGTLRHLSEREKGRKTSQKSTQASGENFWEGINHSYQPCPAAALT